MKDAAADTPAGGCAPVSAPLDPGTSGRGAPACRSSRLGVVHLSLLEHLGVI